MRTFARLSLPAMLVWVSLAASMSAIGQNYIVTDLGTLPGANNSQAWAINDSGQVVGNSGGHAFIWDAADGMQDIGGGSVAAVGISSNGYVTGNVPVTGPCCTYDAFLWNGGSLTDLGGLGAGGSFGQGVNSSGHVVGFSNAHAFLWSGGSMYDLGTLGGSNSFAAGINDAGQVVGNAERTSDNGTTHAFLWQNGTMYDLGDLGGDFSSGNAINSLGQVVGTSETADGARNAFLWENGVMYDLGAGSGFGTSVAQAINNRGEVVGGLGNGILFVDGFVYNQGVMADLNNLISTNSGWVLYTALGVNDHGQIVGSGVHNGQIRAYLLSPVKLEDAQAFQPALDGNGAPYVAAPITNLVDSSFDRIGSLTDGASLVVVQFGGTGTNMTGWAVTLTDPNTPTNGPAVLGSLWHSDGTYTSLPPLPATLTNAGTITVTLDANETAIFYRAAPSWAYGSGAKTTNIEIQVFDQSNNLVVTSPFTLHKPPLVLVHGGVASRDRWNNFQSILDATNIMVDIAQPIISYTNENFNGLDVIYPVLPEAISNEVHRLHDLQVAATRLDVVAHSAGGLVTRWYMTPVSQRTTGDRIDPSLTLTTPRGAQVLPLKFKATTIHDDAQIEFRRADNFGVGDIRRLITMGTPHRGMTWWRQAFVFFNRAIDHSYESRRHYRTGVSILERVWKMRLVALGETNSAPDRGMMMLDLAAFDESNLEDNGKVSRVIAGLPSIPVPYAPIEGIAQPGGPGGVLGDLFEDGVQLLGRFAAGFVSVPTNTLLTNSDGIVPSASAHNLSCIHTQLVLQGRNHSELGAVASDDELASVLADLLGADESLYCVP